MKDRYHAMKLAADELSAAYDELHIATKSGNWKWINEAMERLRLADLAHKQALDGLLSKVAEVVGDG